MKETGLNLLIGGRSDCMIVARLDVTNKKTIVCLELLARLSGI